jgi:carboxymethylenebutenolidase
MSGETIRINGRDGSFSAYLAKPSGAPKAAIVVIQEIFGVNAVMRGLADHYAEQGFLAVAPDLFWRIEPDIQLTDGSEAEWKRAFELFNAFNVDTGVEDIEATIDHVRDKLGVGKVGAVGFCLGGLLAYLTATRTDIDASVGYYGVSIEQRLGEATKLAQPLMLHIASKDQFVPPEAQEKIKAGLKNDPHVTLHVYEGQDHAFARKGGAHYDRHAADLADSRTLTFFRQHLLR